MSFRKIKKIVKGSRKTDVISCTAVFLMTFLAVILILCIGRIAPFGQRSLLDGSNENSVLNLFFQEDGTVIPRAEAFAKQELSDVLSAMEYESVLWRLRGWMQSGGLSCLYSLFWAVCAGLAAVVCFVLLKCRIPGGSPVFFAGAAAYGLCTWLPAYLSHPLWAAVMVLAPLVLVGAERMWLGKSPVFYVLALVVCMILNPAMGCGFVVFSLGYCLFGFFCGSGARSGASGETASGYLPRILRGGRKILKSLGFTLLASVSAAAVLLVSGKVSGTLWNSAENILTWSPGGGLTGILARLVPGQTLRKTYDGINIGMGISALVFLPVYFCNGRIPQKNRAFCGILLALFVFSLDNTGLWYGFQTSGEITGNAAFLFCLFVVLLGCQGIAKWENPAAVHALLCAGNAVLLILMARTGAADEIPVWFYAAAAVMLGILLAQSRELFSRLSHTAAGGIGLKTVNRLSFLRPQRISGILLLSFLIFADSVGNLACVCLAEMGETADSVWETSESGDTGNPMMLPAAFSVSAEAESWTITDSAKPVQSQNELLKLIGGTSGDVYERLGASLFSYGNCALQEGSGWDETFFQTTDISERVYFHYIWDCERDGSYYLENNFRTGSITVKSGDKETELTVSGEGSSWLCLEGLETGSSIEVNVSIEGEQSGCCGMNLYYLHSEEWEEIREQMSASAFCADSVSADEISGTVTVAEDEQLLVVLPLAEEWEIFCDGEAADTAVLVSNLLLVDTGQGTHEMVFTMPG